MGSTDFETNSLRAFRLIEETVMELQSLRERYPYGDDAEDYLNRIKDIAREHQSSV